MHTEQQIEQWAREAGVCGGELGFPDWFIRDLTRFAALVAQSERERAAQIAGNYPRADSWIADEIAAAIRNSDGSKE